MRLVIELDEKYKDLFYEAAKAVKATIISKDDDFSSDIPDHVKAGIEKGLQQAASGQTKSYEEVKKILNGRWG